MAVQIQLRRGTSAEWAAHNPILAQGEFVTELDTNRTKIGNGIDHWNDLSYTDEAVLGEISSHINNETPHPAYDDMQSLTLLFENGLV